MKIGIGVKFKRAPGDARPWREVYEESIEYARAADRLGYDYVVVPEHHSVEIGFNPTPFMTLTAIARETRRIGLSTQPLLLPLYHPVHVAEQLAGLDLLSGGRAMLGVGAGYREGDFTAFGVPRKARGALMDEGLTLLLRALRERNFSHRGRFWQVEGVDITPRPLQEPHPKIFVTARSAAAVDRAARFGLGINTLHREATTGGIYASYASKVVASGLDPSSVDVTIVRNGYVAPTRDEAIRVGGPYVQSRNAHMSGYSGRDRPFGEFGEVRYESSDGTVVVTQGELLGTPEDWLRAVEEDAAALSGPVPFGGYTLGLWPEGMPFEDGMTALELFAREVLPAVQARRPAAGTRA
jgi:alkanesulfonate monooxygenase SsuD/methylene tetrahydromethanopterin reductase-like flavin-dependent oxidoreductase (luciferase family)